MPILIIAYTGRNQPVDAVLRMADTDDEAVTILRNYCSFELPLEAVSATAYELLDSWGPGRKLETVTVG